MSAILAAAAAAGALALAANGSATEPPLLGNPAPEFELADQTGQLHSLEDYREQWVVLYFYPKDNTPGCTTEACEFRDNIFAYRDLNAQILGVSLDDVDSHREFAEHHSLPFPLLADVDGSVAESYGVKTRMFGMAVAKRQTFIIDPNGNVVTHYKKVKPAQHSAQVIADLRSLVKSATLAELNSPSTVSAE
ncbi:MAG: peroxiredoxin [Gammaproteobacteria bacterium]|nr:peroxiredoxin [Gammaproteobacteria bacterium]MBT8111174.1 peroxiredoxin [Gammaproteobacteria bacterium]NND48086.1 peroxiredoxin [Woeseiaceae bacterium]NNL45872.1 peroxiredoxin [Woeseiaceae bacterium]